MTTAQERIILAKAALIKAEQSRARKAKLKAERKARGTVTRHREIDNAHLAFVRRLPCVACGASPCDAAHVRFGDASRGKVNAGMQRKPDDFWTLPLDRSCHERQHAGNERAFYDALGIDALALCEALYEVSGDLEKGTALIRQSRSSLSDKGR